MGGQDLILAPSQGKYTYNVHVNVHVVHMTLKVQTILSAGFTME